MATKKIKNYPQKAFAHAVVAVDISLFSVIQNELKVILLRLKEEPFVGQYALPGGLVTQHETLENAVKRHLKEKANAKNIYIEQLYTFGDPNRDPKGWVVSVAYLGLATEDKFRAETDKRYESIGWYTVQALPKLAYDQKTVITDLLKQEIYTVAFVAFGTDGTRIATEMGIPSENVLDESADHPR